MSLVNLDFCSHYWPPQVCNTSVYVCFMSPAAAVLKCICSKTSPSWSSCSISLFSSSFLSSLPFSLFRQEKRSCSSSCYCSTKKCPNCSRVWQLACKTASGLQWLVKYISTQARKLLLTQEHCSGEHGFICNGLLMVWKWYCLAKKRQIITWIVESVVWTPPSGKQNIHPEHHAHTLEKVSRNLCRSNESEWNKNHLVIWTWLLHAS